LRRTVTSGPQWARFSTWWIPTPSGQVDHLPTHNGSYKRDILLAHATELETLLAAEIVLQWELVARGHRLYLDAKARVHHVNFERLSSWMPLKYHAGRVFAGVRSRHWSSARRALYACGSPLIPLLGLRHVLRQIRRRSPAHLPLAVYPLLGLGLAASALGEALGYAFGLGSAVRDLGRYEFHRERHLRGAERP
jgi:hypothetical protein